MLGIFTSTIHIRIRSFGLEGAREFSDIKNQLQQLKDDIIRSTQSVFSNCGEISRGSVMYTWYKSSKKESYFIELMRWEWQFNAVLLTYGGDII